MQGLSHMGGQDAWTSYVGQFFRCYLRSDAGACSYLENRPGAPKQRNDTLCEFKPMLDFKGTVQCFTPSHPCDPSKGMLC